MEHAHVIHADGHTHEPHPDSYYIKIWAVLLVLLVLSVLGPMIGHPTITLITAFGIAFVKAGLVCGYFMHLAVEKKFISYLLLASVLLMGVMFAGVAPDVLKGKGANWAKTVHITLPPPVHHETGHSGSGHADDTQSPVTHH